jgi:uncharacterized membrane protein
MEKKTERELAAEKARTEAKHRLIFGVIAAVVVVGLIALIFAIDRYGQSRMANVDVQTHNSAER